jgi:lysophospholipase L1-like esterase
MRRIESAWSVISLPPGRSLALTAVASLLAGADWLPPNHYIDPDWLEFALTIALGGAAVVIAMRERIDAQTVLQWRRRGLLLSVTLALLLGGAEAATRWIFRNVTTSSDNGGYFSRRWARTGAVTLNRAGFRGPAFTDVTPAGVFRVAVVGDSFTYGNGIRQQDRFSDVLQTELPPHVEVLNFGRPGANTPEHRALVEDLLARVHPDFVLLQWYVNDMEDDDAIGRPVFLPLMPVRSVHRWLNDVSALYTIANMQWAETQVALRLTVSYEQYLKQRLGHPDSPDAQFDRRLLNDLVFRCKQAGVGVGIVLFPDTAGRMGAEYPFAYLHQRVQDVCDAQEITCLDLRNDFAAIKDRQSLWASRLDHHPSARANAIAAERIMETFAKNWVASLPQ